MSNLIKTFADVSGLTLADRLLSNGSLYEASSDEQLRGSRSSLGTVLGAPMLMGAMWIAALVMAIYCAYRINNAVAQNGLATVLPDVRLKMLNGSTASNFLFNVPFVNVLLTGWLTHLVRSQLPQ